MRAGHVTFVARNVGRIEHELVVVRTTLPHGSLSKHIRMAAHMAAHVHVAPGQTGRLRLSLRPGRYVLICDLPGHYEAGQHAAFVVR